MEDGSVTDKKSSPPLVTVSDSLLRRMGVALGRHKIISSSVIAIALVLVGNSWLMTPAINLSPTKKVVMRGKFPFHKGWELRIARSFYARNELCSMTARVFFFIPQAKVSREFALPFMLPKRLDGSQYAVEYYEDYFVPGFCDWTPGFVSYYIVEGERVIDGAAILDGGHRYNKIDYTCAASSLPTRIPGKNQTVTVCSEGKNRSFDSSRTYTEINFLWKE